MTAAAAEIRPPPGPAPAPIRAASPYKFPDFYERRDAANFAGRDQEIDDIAAGVARSRCFVLDGRSGLGKTSLLHAGVIPRLEQRGFEVRYLRLLADPVHELCAAVAAQLGREATSAEELPALLAARLVPVVKTWLDAEPTFDRFRFAKKLIASLCAERRWRSELGGLLSANQLSQQVEPYALRLLLSPLEAEYVLRSAIHDQRRPVATWARIYDEAAGNGQPAAVVAEFAAHLDRAVRCGAARAIAEVADPQLQLPALCLTLALEDSAEVRRAAGRSLAAIARPQELQLIPGSTEQTTCTATVSSGRGRSPPIWRSDSCCRLLLCYQAHSSLAREAPTIP